MKHTVLLLIILLLGFGSFAEAQTGQIVLHPGITMIPNPSPFIADWQSNPITITLTVPMTEQCNFPVKLMAEATLNGETVARTNPSKMEITTFHFGTNTFNARDIVPIKAIEFPSGIDGTYKRLGRLPEGNYSLCVWFIDATTGRVIPGSVCNPFTIQGINPPVLVAPANGANWSEYFSHSSDNSPSGL
ncbi:MAG: hypothetical protein Q8896_14415, partial [Bacteroidota bacterium]|nr:hypothetical protein [Bacteroidota bacterium]